MCIDHLKLLLRLSRGEQRRQCTVHTAHTQTQDKFHLDGATAKRFITFYYDIYTF